ncbi:MAG: RNA polymerase sigma factor RpoH, partial [Burkholderiales bacterium]|nr:RNA polymerase sigma factor RpoH [Burkholderiales bacterium]
MTTALTELTHGNALAVSASSWAKFDLPVPVGNLEAYISAVHRIPLLSQDEELA